MMRSPWLAGASLFLVDFIFALAPGFVPSPAKSSLYLCSEPEIVFF